MNSLPERIQHFETNIAACAPLLTDDTEERLRAQFATMRSQNDYRKIHSELRAIAETHSIRLSEIRLGE